jgi:hypothetical protein
MMMPQDDFTRIQSELLRCNAQQRAVLLRQLRAQGTEETRSGLQSGAIRLWNDIQMAFQRCGVHLPPLGVMRETHRWLPARLTMVSIQVEDMLDRELKGTTRQERDAVRTFVTLLATEHVKMTCSGAVQFDRVLAVLAVPEQVLDDNFPGYRTAGVLREMLLRYVHRNGARAIEENNNAS